MSGENLQDRPTAPTPDPGFAPLLDMLDAPDARPMSDMTPTEARETFAALGAMEGPPVRGVTTTDRAVPGPAGDIPIRVVRPDEASPIGVLVWFHGGGFVLGDLDTTDDVTRKLALAAHCLVVSVDYRLAPEHRAPAAAEDCAAVTRWVGENREDLGVAPTAPMAVGGDSAGGNLAAVCAQLAASGELTNLAAQLLVYPVVDFDMSGERYPSYRENGEGLFLTTDTMTWFAEQYLDSDTDTSDPGVAPIHAEDSVLAATAPAIVVVAGFDPLRDEGIAYAERLRSVGVSVELLHHPEMIHAFWSMGALTPVADRSIGEAATALTRFMTEAGR